MTSPSKFVDIQIDRSLVSFTTVLENLYFLLIINMDLDKIEPFYTSELKRRMQNRWGHRPKF
jgi:hypothetical protein